MTGLARVALALLRSITNGKPVSRVRATEAVFDKVNVSLVTPYTILHIIILTTLAVPIRRSHLLPAAALQCTSRLPSGRRYCIRFTI